LLLRCMPVIHDQAVDDQISFQRVDGSSTAGIQSLTAIVENRVVEFRDLVYAGGVASCPRSSPACEPLVKPAGGEPVVKAIGDRPQ
jgi:hypothetical protein